MLIVSRLANTMQAGLFSAVVTTFVAQSSQALSPDYAQITASLIYELVLMQRAADSGSGEPSKVPMSPLSFNSKTHQPTDIWVNALWLVSLTLSLLTALMAVLAKQWIQVRAFLSSLDKHSSRFSPISSTTILCPRDHRAIVPISATTASEASSAGRCPP